MDTMSRPGAAPARVFVDERGIVNAVDRITGGLYVVDMTL